MVYAETCDPNAQSCDAPARSSESDHRRRRHPRRQCRGSRASGPASPSCCRSAPAVAAVDVRGGAPGTRETERSIPTCLVDRVDAVVLTGGSAFGLDAAPGGDGLARRAGARLRRRRGARADRAGGDPVRSLNGGAKDWGEQPPYRRARPRRARRSAGQRLRARQCRRRATAPRPARSRAASAAPRRLARTGSQVGALVAVNSLRRSR